MKNKKKRNPKFYDINFFPTETEEIPRFAATLFQPPMVSFPFTTRGRVGGEKTKAEAGPT